MPRTDEEPDQNSTTADFRIPFRIPTIRPVTPPNRRTLSSNRASHFPPQRRPPGPSHTLTCGAEPVPTLLDPTNPKPWGSSLKCVVPFLPLPLDDRLSQFPKAKLSTGCGAEIYARASPRGGKTWNATAGAAGPTVAPLPAEYFTDEQKYHLAGGPKKEECGCVTFGVGCCVCGNALGVCKTHCLAHLSMLTGSQPTSYIFLADAVSPPLPSPCKIPISVDRRESRTPSRTDAFNLETWLSQSRDRPREPSPTRSELMNMARQRGLLLEETRLESAFAQSSTTTNASNAIIRRIRQRRDSSSIGRQSPGMSSPLPVLEDHAELQETVTDEDILTWTLRNGAGSGGSDGFANYAFDR
ncbi:hypothetical protein C8R44DRAFT_868660 [Mycena epipterygia]|nr:hypothetical protein C8R44DRAFT_868660 [Mycena epipterygia]